MNQAVENDEKELNQLNSWIESVTGTDYKNFTRCNFGSRQNTTIANIVTITNQN